MSKMSGKVIEAVADRPTLWDTNDPGFKDRSLKEALWEQVAKHAGLSVSDAKLKWCSARDYYAALIRKNPSLAVDPDGIHRPRWKYWDIMQFYSASSLKNSEKFYEDMDTTAERTETDSPSFYGTISPPEIKHEVYETDSHEVYFVDDGAPHQSKESEIEVVRKPPTKKRKNQEETTEDNFEEDLLHYVRQQGKILDRVVNTQNSVNHAESGQDDVELFLLSMAPTIRKLSEQRNIVFRIKAQELLLQLMQEDKAGSSEKS